MKNKNKIGEIGEPCGIPVDILNSCDSPSNSLIVVVRFCRKLRTQLTITRGIRFFRKL